MLSVVIPVYNEAESLMDLYQGLVGALDELAKPFEVIMVNDGSTDHTEATIAAIARADDRIRVINFKRNFGQTAAMMAGIDHAKGDVIVPMDGDMQNDPKDIARLLAKLEDGFDVVSGWRKDRKDKEWGRKLPSKLANRLISRMSGVHLHDYGCSLKAYRREVIKDVRLYGEMHRFIPIYASWSGGRVTEIPVEHGPRAHGASNYGMERILKVLLDLIVVKFLADYATKPIYVFGTAGVLCIFISGVSGAAALFLKIERGVSLILTPLPLLTVFTLLTGVMFILMGLLAEIIMRTYYESQGKKSYLIKSTLNIRR